MSMQDLTAALEIIERHRGQADFVGPRDETLVRAAELALGLVLPPTYRRFVEVLGAGNFRAAEFYGVIDENFRNSSVPNGIWVTLNERNQSQLPKELIVVADSGDGDYYCLQTGKSEEAPVVIFQPGLDPSRRREQVAEDFGAFLLEQVEAQRSRP